MIRRIVTVPDGILRKTAAPVEDIGSKHVRSLIEDMKETVITSDGIGIAAPQIGESLRIIVINFQKEPYALLNPDVTWSSEGTSILEEGCLSIPGQTVLVPRPNQVHVHALKEDGTPIDIRAKDLLAKILQHEIDHINGVLITDYLPGEGKALL